MSDQRAPAHPSAAKFECALKSAAMVTTPWQVSARSVSAAHTFGDWFECPVVERHGRSLPRLFADCSVDAIVVADQQPVLYHRNRPEDGLFVHPGLARARISQLRTGQADRLVAAAGIRPGDVVVDATLGLGVDTLVLAAAAGTEGHVLGLESSWMLARLFEYTLQHGSAWHAAMWSNLRDGAAKVDVYPVPHETWLCELADDSVDVVYFDPMFRHAPKGTSSVEGLRPFAATARLSSRAWTEAKRVARRCVVMKERPGFGQFERFCLEPDRPRGRTAFGVWHKRRGGMSL